MTLFEAIILGFFQGVTEFLPVSSSGHLVLGEHFFEMKPSAFLFFDLILHLATLLAVCLFFRQRLFRIAANSLAFVQSQPNEEAKEDRSLVLAIILSTLITGSIGIAYKDMLEGFRDSLPAVGICFLITGGLLLATQIRSEVAKQNLTPYPPNLWIFALVLGLAQAVAIAPGVSRSGATVCAALLLGTAKPRAVEYSFLMSIPAILGATLLEFKDAEIIFDAIPAFAGFLTALVSGVLFLWMLVWIVNRGALHHFAYYTIPLGIGVLWYSL